jgi:hypothetical protein
LYEQSSHSVFFYQFQYELDSQFFAQTTVHGFDLWLMEILTYSNPFGDFDKDAIENQSDNILSIK